MVEFQYCSGKGTGDLLLFKTFAAPPKPGGIMNGTYIGRINMEFQWSKEPVSYTAEGGRIVMETCKGTNLFNSMTEERRDHNFPYYYTECEGDFLIRCQITPEFGSLYDQGDIIIYADDDHWIKFAYENTDLGYPAMVSVVTNQISDDCNGVPQTGGIWMQAVRQGDNFALHYSEDGEQWKMARIFRLELPRKVKAGISAQSPFGVSLKVTFSGLMVTENPYTNIRKPR